MRRVPKAVMGYVSTKAGQLHYTSQWHLLMAAATVVIAPVLVLFFIAQRYFIEGITLTGMKA